MSVFRAVVGHIDLWRVDHVILLSVLAGLGVAVFAARVEPTLAQPAYFGMVGLIIICVLQTYVLWVHRQVLRKRYLCGGPPTIAGVWICPLLASGRTRADQPRGAVNEITLTSLAPAQVQPDARTQTLAERSGMRILVIEDDALSRHVISHQLQGAGHSVVQAADGGEGLYMLGSEHPDVVVLDLHLPTVSGQQIARVKDKIEQARGEHARVVVLTVDADAAAEASDLGADAFLVKPVTGEHLVQTVQALAPHSKEISI